MKYLGANALKYLSYSAVCSCTVLPIFAGIYLRGAGIGPATTFLYSGPAINVLAIVLTAKILGFDLPWEHNHWFNHGIYFYKRRKKGLKALNLRRRKKAFRFTKEFQFLLY
jgi:hypothetical protein